MNLYWLINWLIVCLTDLTETMTECNGSKRKGQKGKKKKKNGK